MKAIALFQRIFSKINTLQEWFKVIKILGDTLEYANKRFQELDLDSE